MSKFSGKCDLADIITIFGGWDKFKEANVKIYLGKKEEDKEIDYKEYKDLIPYLPHIEIMGCHSKDSSDKSFMVLSEESWVDIEERLYGHMEIHDHYRKMLEEELNQYK